MYTLGGRRDAPSSQLLKLQSPTSRVRRRGTIKSTAITNSNHSSTEIIRLASTGSSTMAGVSFLHSYSQVVAFVAFCCCCLPFDLHTSPINYSQQYSQTSATGGSFLVRGRQQQGLTALLCKLLPLPSLKGAAAVASAEGADDGGVIRPTQAYTHTPHPAARRTTPAGSLGAVKHSTGGSSATPYNKYKDTALEETRRKNYELAFVAGAAQEQRKQKRREGEKEQQLHDKEISTREINAGRKRAHTTGGTKNPQKQSGRKESKMEKKTAFAKLLQNVTRWILGKTFQSSRRALTHANKEEKNKKQLRTRNVSTAKREHSTLAETAAIGDSHGASPSAADTAAGAPYLEDLFPVPPSMTGAAKRFDNRVRSEDITRYPRRSRSTVDTSSGVALPAASSTSPQPLAAVSVAPLFDAPPPFYHKPSTSIVHDASSTTKLKLTLADSVTKEQKALHETAAFVNERERSMAVEGSSTDATLAAHVNGPGAAARNSQILRRFPCMGIAAKSANERARVERMSNGPTQTGTTASKKHRFTLPAPPSALLGDPRAVPFVFPSSEATAGHCIAQSSCVDDVPSAGEASLTVHVVTRRLAAPLGHVSGEIYGEVERSNNEPSDDLMSTQPQARTERKSESNSLITGSMHLQPPEVENEETSLPEISRSRAYRRRKRGRQATEDAATRPGGGWVRGSRSDSGVAKTDGGLLSVLTQPTTSDTRGAAAAGRSSLGREEPEKTLKNGFGAVGGDGFSGAVRSSGVVGRGVDISQIAPLSNASGIGRDYDKGIRWQKEELGATGESRLHPVKHESGRKWDDVAPGTSRPPPLYAPLQRASWTGLSGVHTHTMRPAAVWKGKEMGLTGTSFAPSGRGDHLAPSKMELARQRYQQEAVLRDVIGTTAAINAESGRAAKGAQQGRSEQTATPKYSAQSLIKIGLPDEGATEYGEPKQSVLLPTSPALWQQEELQLGKGVEKALHVPDLNHQEGLGEFGLHQSQLETNQAVAVGRTGHEALTPEAREAEEEKEVQKLVMQQYLEQPLKKKQRWNLILKAVVNLLAVAAMALVSAQIMDTFSVKDSTKYIVLLGLVTAVLGERVIQGLRYIGKTSQLLVQDTFLRGERQQVLAVAEALRTIEEQNKAHAAGRSADEGRADVDQSGEVVSSPSEEDHGGAEAENRLLDGLDGGGLWE